VEWQRWKSCGQKKKCTFLVQYDTFKKSEIIHCKIMHGKNYDDFYLRNRKISYVNTCWQKNFFKRNNTKNEHMFVDDFEGPFVFKHVPDGVMRKLTI
jgi:hypothetical protein